MMGIDQAEFSRPLRALTPKSMASAGALGGETFSLASDPLLEALSDQNVQSSAGHPSMRLTGGPKLKTDLTTSAIRPATAPETQSERFMADTFPLTQMLPPKRSLPFAHDAKPSARPNVETSEALQQADHQAAVPAEAKVEVTKPKSKATTSRAKKPTPASKASRTQPVRSKKKQEPEKKEAPSAEVKQKEEVKKKPVKRARSTSPFADEIDIPKKTSLNITTNIEEEPANASSKAADADSKPSRDPKKTIDPAEFLTTLDKWVRKFNDIPVPQPPKTSKDTLAEYAAKSDEDRHEAIEDLICECLEDEHFATLAKDVENSWTRIGLGF